MNTREINVKIRRNYIINRISFWGIRRASHSLYSVEFSRSIHTRPSNQLLHCCVLSLSARALILPPPPLYTTKSLAKQCENAEYISRIVSIDLFHTILHTLCVYIIFILIRHAKSIVCVCVCMHTFGSYGPNQH